MLTAFFARRYLLRRAALRAASSSSASIAITARPRTFTSLTSASAFRPHQQQWLAVSQRRFNSEDASSVRPSQENTTDETVTSEQSTAVDAETSAQSAQTETAPFDSAPQPEQQANRGPYMQVDENQKTLYVGNMFYQTTEDHLRQEFSRFGNIVKTMIVRDPAGLSRGYFSLANCVESLVANACCVQFPGSATSSMTPPTAPPKL